MVYPIMRQRNYQSYPANNMLQKQSSNIAPSRNNIQSKVQPLVTKGVGGLSKTLNNVQQVLNVVQSTTPIVQQYGPMVKNIPAMYKMIKAFKDVEDVESTDNSTPKTKNLNRESTNKIPTEKVKDQSINQNSNNGQSTPKLFI